MVSFADQAVRSTDILFFIHQEFTEQHSLVFYHSEIKDDHLFLGRRPLAKH